MARQPQVTRFTVEGSGQFPFDMLRYDQCWPVGLCDAAQMKENNYRRIVLETHRKSAPTDGRWESFCWRVVE